MKKCIVNGIWFMVLLLSTIHYLPSTVKASTASTSADPGTQSILTQLQQEIASKAAQIKTQVSSSIQNRAYAGIIQTLSDTNYTLLDQNGQVRNITLNDFTKDIINVKGSKKIAKGDFVVALGDVDDKNNLVAKQIVKTSSPSAQTVDFLWGKIKSKTNTTIIVTTRDNKDITVTFTIATTFVKNGSSDALMADVKVGNILTAVGNLKGDTFAGRFVYLAPSADRPTPSPSPTKSASSSATPSAKKKS